MTVRLTRRTGGGASGKFAEPVRATAICPPSRATVARAKRSETRGEFEPARRRS